MKEACLDIHIIHFHVINVIPYTPKHKSVKIGFHRFRKHKYAVSEAQMDIFEPFHNVRNYCISILSWVILISFALVCHIGLIFPQ